MYEISNYNFHLKWPAASAGFG